MKRKASTAKRRIRAAVVLAAALSIGSVQAGTISLNTAGNSGSGSPVEGAPGVSVSNWNACVTGGNELPKYWGTGVGGNAVKNDSGTTVAGLDATLTVFGGSRTIAFGTINPTWRPSSLFNYTVRVDVTNPLSVNTVAVTGIPYARYDLYVYITGSSLPGGVGRIRVGSQTKYVRGDVAPVFPDSWTYTEVDHTTDPGGAGVNNANADSVPVGTYVRFAGLTGDSLDFDVTGYTRVTTSGGAGSVYFGGFQITDAPMPGTAIMIR